MKEHDCARFMLNEVECGICGWHKWPDPNDDVMDMTYPQLERAPLFDDRDDDWDEESGTGEPDWVNFYNL